MSMFCYQCEQAAKGTGCTAMGVCGKDSQVAALLDLLIEAVKGISMYAHRAGELGATDRQVDVFVIKALFTTVTNVSFDAARIAKHAPRWILNETWPPPGSSAAGRIATPATRASRSL